MRRRTRIATGIYRDRYGLAATVAVGSGRAKQQREQRFPADTDLEMLKRWQVQTRAELQGEQEDAAAIDEPAPTHSGTFASDVKRYLKLIAGRASYKSDRSHLSAWLPRVGHLKRSAIKASHVRSAFAAWLSAGKSARTIRHRRRVLRELYQVLDGAHARPPIKGVKLPRPADATPTPTAIETIQRVARSLRRGLKRKQACGPTRKVVSVQRAESPKTYARFIVRATTGQRPSQIMRAKPTDVDLQRRIWFVRPAKGGTPIPLPLNDEMVRAWRIFRWVKAWGTFDTRSFSKTIRRHGWPADVRPYNLRHTFAIDHLLAGTSIGEVQGLLGHRQIETTRRSYAPIQVALLKKAVGARRLKLA